MRSSFFLLSTSFLMVAASGVSARLLLGCMFGHEFVAAAAASCSGRSCMLPNYCLMQLPSRPCLPHLQGMASHSAGYAAMPSQPALGFEMVNGVLW